MARRTYRRRQVKSEEVFITLVTLVTILLIIGMPSIPQAIIPQFIILIFCVVILVTVAYYYFVYRKLVIQREGLSQLRIDDVDSMSGVKFEEYVAELFRREGYRIQNTATSGDYGVDLIIVKDGIRTAIQTKRYSKPVNQAAIREAVAGMKHYKCTRSMVVTNNHFTHFAIGLAQTNECTLIDREKLIEMIASRY